MADDGKKVSELNEIDAIADSDLIHVASNGESKNSPFTKVVAYIKSKLTKSDVGLGNVDNVRQYSASNKPTKSDVGLGNVDNVRQYSASNKPTKSDVGLGNVDNVRQYSASNSPPYPVTSVNNKTGAVSLDYSDVGALDSTKIFVISGTVTTSGVGTASFNDTYNCNEYMCLSVVTPAAESGRVLIPYKYGDAANGRWGFTCKSSGSLESISNTSINYVAVMYKY